MSIEVRPYQNKDLQKFTKYLELAQDKIINSLGCVLLEVYQSFSFIFIYQLHRNFSPFLLVKLYPIKEGRAAVN